MDQITEIIVQYPWLREWYVIALAALTLGWLLRGVLSIGTLKRNVAALRGEADLHRNAAEESARARAALDVDYARMQERAGHAEHYKDRLDETNDVLREAEQQIARLDSELTSERNNHAARMEELRGAQDALEKRFDELARKALDGNAERFLTSVTERFEKHKQAADADLGARQKGIETLLQPIRENLTKFEAQNREIEKAREGAYRTVTEQVSKLHEEQRRLTTETNRLVTALRAPKTRGNWGNSSCAKWSRWQAWSITSISTWKNRSRWTAFASDPMPP